jgi:hypothetical protein
MLNGMLKASRFSLQHSLQHSASSSVHSGVTRTVARIHGWKQHWNRIIPSPLAVSFSRSPGLTW